MLSGYFLLIFSLFCNILLVQPQATGTVSLFENREYQNLRSCARGCFWHSDCCPNVIANFLSCPHPNDAYNDCWCWGDLTSLAGGYLSRCVRDSCGSNAIDISSALSLYTNYCEMVFPQAKITTEGPSTETLPTPEATSISTTLIP